MSDTQDVHKLLGMAETLRDLAASLERKAKQLEWAAQDKAVFEALITMEYPGYGGGV